MRTGAAFVALCSSHARHAVGFQLDTNPGGVVGRSEGAVRFGARIEVSQEHTGRAERREIFDKVSYAVGFGALSTSSCVFGPYPSLAEVDLETDFGQDTTNPKTISSATNTPDNEPASVVECDEDCKEQRRKMIEDRRAMMRQSRSTSSRQEVFELSKQRARMYGSDYKGTNCIDGVPCI